VGRILVATGAVGAVTAIVGTVVAWIVIGDVNQATRDSLDVTISTLDSLQDNLDLAGELIGATTTSLESVEASLDALEASFVPGSAVVGDASDLTASTAPSLRNVTGTLRRLETLGSQIDTILSSLSSLPLTPDYDPEQGLGDTFGQLATDLEPLPDELEATSASLAELEAVLPALQTELGALADSVRAVNDGLAGSEELLDGYQANLDQARAVAEGSRRDLSRDEILLRLVIVVAGLTALAAQLVPLWLGSELLDRTAPEGPAPGGTAPDTEGATTSAPGAWGR
jgi:hypothetical protein